MATPKKQDTVWAQGGMTYHEIAAVLGLSHTRVQQIEKEAIAKIRRHLHPDLIPDEPRVDPSIYI